MSSVCNDMNNLIASALLDNSSCDPYAFPMDDAVVEETSGTGDPSGRSIPRISVYSKTFSSQKSVASNGKMLPPENGFYPNQNELSLSQYSVTCDSLPTWHHDQTKHPHSEIKVTHSTKQNDNFSSAQTPEIGLPEQLAIFSHLEQDATPMQNGVWNLVAETESSETQKTNKKKKRNKTAGGDGNEVAKRKPKKTVKNILNAGSDSNGGAGKAGLSSSQNRGPPSSNAQFLWDNHPGVLCAKNAAPQLPLKASASAKASSVLPSENIFWGLPVQCTPTTTTITTVSNSTISNMNYVKCTSSSQRQTSSSQESQSSRPSSSNATTGKSDNNSKQANSIPLSKVMEIIEREKARGSPSPCKRRRTAKPQHIQIAEEEARKFVTAAAANSMEKRLSSIPTAGNLKTDVAKKGLGDSLHSSGFKAEFTASLKKGKKWTSSSVSGLDSCSVDEHSKIKPASQDVTSQNGQQASSSGIFYSGSMDKICNSVVNPPEITQMQTFTDKLVSQSLCEPDIQQSFSHQNETSQTPSPSLSTTYSQQPCSNFQLTDSMSSSTQFDTLRTSSTSSENFNQHFMQFSAYDEQTLLSPPHTASVKSEAVSMPNFENSFYSNHNSLLSEGTSPTQWSAEISGDCSTSDVISHTAVNFAHSANNHQPLVRNMKSQGVSVSTACTDWKPQLNGSISIKDSYFSHRQSTLPSSLSATSPSKLACESASLNCSHSSSKLYSPAGPIKLHDSAALPSFDALVANSIGSHVEPVQSQLSTMHQQINVERLDLPQQQQKKKSRNKQKLSESSVGKKKQQSPPKVKNQNPPVYAENFAHSFPGGGARNLHSPLKDANSFKSEVKVNGTQTYSSNKMSSSPNQQLPSPQYLVQSPVQSLPSPNKPLSSTCWQMPSASRLPQSPNQSLPSPSQPAHSPVTKMEPFLAPMNLEEELDDRLRYNKVESAPQCGCLGPNYVYNESVEGPYYTQLGTARDLVAIREIMEKRTGLSGNAIRIEKIHYTGKEGRSAQGCPIAKWIIRRSGVHEKYLCVTRKRPGHFCDAAYIIVAIVAWEGVTTDRADSLYSYLVSMLTKYGMETDRRCGTNEQKTCACQGVDLIRRGASFSFGCSWSMYFNGCKFGRSHTARKFKLKDTQKEAEMEEQMQDLATVVAPLYKAVAPDAYRNQVHFEEQAKMCRLGKEKGRPFSGVTACVDFCAHSHKDFHNMQNGSTVVVTLTKHRELVKPEDEQLHVLPLYVLDETDEYGSTEGHMEKIKTGSLEILHKYPMQARTRSSPVTPKKRGRTPKKESPGKSECKRTGSDLMGNKAGASSAPPTPTTPSSLEKDTSFLHSHDSSNSLPDVSTISGNSATNSAMHTPEKSQNVKEASFVDKENLSSIDEDTWSQSFEPTQLYDKMWDYFYSNGTFPPTSSSDKRAAAQKLAMVDHQISGVSANRECKPETNSHQASPQPMQQAANVASQHQCSSDSQDDVPLAQNIMNGIKVEAGCCPDSACDVQSLTNISCHNNVGSVIASFQQVSGISESLPQGDAHFASAQGDGMSVSTVLGSSLDILSEAAFVNGQAPDQSSLCLSLATSLPRQTSTQAISAQSSSASLTSLHAAPFPPSLVSVASVVYPFTSHSTSDNHKGESLSDKTPFLSAKASCDGGNPSLCNDPSSSSSSSLPVMQPNGSFIMPTLGQGPNEPTFTMMDPSVVKCEWQNNEENFLDPSIGGVAIALNHRAVLFEVAKREVHATTALKNPNRYQPTRISLVFYQHKNLNYSHHGYYEYEHKLKAQRQKRMEKLMEEGATAAEAEVAVKPGRKRKKKTVDGEEEDVVDFAKTSAAQYKYLWDTTVRHSQALTTDSIITRWIDPQPMVTGPYQRWV